MAELALRDYQVDALDRVGKAEARGVRKQLGVAATGLGKTIMFCALARERGCRTLILAHRDELVSQAVAKVREVWPDVDVGIVKAADNDVRSQVVVASVQTLSRSRRLAQLVASTLEADGLAAWGGLATVEPFGLVVVDEAHHAYAQSYRTILDALGAGQEDGPLLLGVTATPDRGDGKGLNDLFDEVVFNYDLLWGIRSDYLCDVRALRCVIDVDLSKVKVRGGDYEVGAVGAALENAHAPQVIVHQWKEHASDRRTLVFVPTVALSKEVEREFRAHGVKCAHVDGTTDLDERRAILRGYADGTIQVVTNCMVLTEGFDSPRTDCIVQARPTKSRALFTQMVGRGTRKHPDKRDLLVLDVVGVSNELSLVTVPSLFGIDMPEFAGPLGDGTGILSDVVQERDDWLAKTGKITTEQADLFRQMRERGKVAWVHVKIDGKSPRYQRTLGDGQSAVVLVRRQYEDLWLAGLIHPDGKKQILLADVSLEMAQGVGEDVARKLGKRGLVDADAQWRRRKPTPKQREFAKKLAVNISGLKTAGEVSDAIDAHVAAKRATKKRKASA